MKVINDKSQDQPSETTVPRKTLDEWQKKDAAQRSRAEGSVRGEIEARQRPHKAQES